MLARLAPCHRMGGYLFFKSSGLLCESLLTNTRLLVFRMR